MKARCGDQVDTAAALWLVSDMAFAAHTAGKDDRCVELISSVDDEAASANPKVAKALLYNARLCKPKEDCDYKLDQDEPVCKMELAVAYGERSALGGFAAPACGVKNHEKGVALPDGSCLEASALRRKGKEEDMDATCPALYRIDAKGKRTKVAVDGGAWLESPSECCALVSIKVKSEGGATGVLLGSNQPTRDCFGGTATTDFLSLFKLTGSALELVKDYSIAWH